ncbi:MAG: guanosine pentaphosphatase [Psychromonas sp.]|nr:guanosine pentaphosphatase [Alteromonadales bacterium]MCP5079004.1 guanosine pentaphosphatase [Psychromonas sp.]
MINKRYTIIDLGSNSFHMLTVNKTGDGFSVFSKKKQKVRLASGLDKNNNLDQQTIDIGLNCLQKFRKELDKLQPEKLIITATAALRLANNKQQFISQAEDILQYPIRLISGTEEAKTIYRGVAFTERSSEQLLVIDIGGASTELIIGQGNNVLKAESLDMGCVTWLNNFFSDRLLNENNFNQAISAAKTVVEAQLYKYKPLGWSLCMGASGTIQAVNEVNAMQQLEKALTLSLLNQIKQQCINVDTIDKLNIVGLKESRKPVFASGLAILIALFECLEVSSIKPSKGALREGLISILFEE